MLTFIHELCGTGNYILFFIYIVMKLDDEALVLILHADA